MKQSTKIGGIDKSYMIDSISYGAVFDDNLLFFSRKYGVIGKWDFFNQTDSEILFTPQPCSMEHLTICGNVLYALDGNGRYLYSISPYDSKVKRFYLPCESSQYNLFMDLVACDDKLVIVPRFQSCIWIYDIKECVLKRWIIEVGNDIGRLHDQFTGVMSDQEYWMFPFNGRYVLEFDIRSGLLFQHKRDLNLLDSIHATSHNGDIYILTKNGNVSRWDKRLKCSTKICSIEKESSFFRIVATDKKLIVLPHDIGDPIYLIDLVSNLWEEYMDYPEGFIYEKSASAYAGRAESNSYVLYMPHSTSYMLLIDKMTGELKWINAENMYSDQTMKTLMSIKTNQSINEESVGLSKWMEYIKSRKDYYDITSEVKYIFD